MNRLIAKIRSYFAPKVVPDLGPQMNRAQRRALANQKPGEQRMRLERTFISQTKRRSSRRGDHGAKAKQAYKAGVDAAVTYLHTRVQMAYVAGVKEGRKQRWFFGWGPKSGTTARPKVGA